MQGVAHARWVGVGGLYPQALRLTLTSNTEFPAGLLDVGNGAERPGPAPSGPDQWASCRACRPACPGPHRPPSMPSGAASPHGPARRHTRDAEGRGARQPGETQRRTTQGRHWPGWPGVWSSSGPGRAGRGRVPPRQPGSAALPGSDARSRGADAHARQLLRARPVQDAQAAARWAPAPARA